MIQNTFQLLFSIIFHYPIYLLIQRKRNVSFHSSSKRKVSILIVSENISENYFRKIVILILFLNLIQTSTFHPIYLFIQRKRNFNLKIFSKIKSDSNFYFLSNLFIHSKKKKCFDFNRIWKYSRKIVIPILNLIQNTFQLLFSIIFHYPIYLLIQRKRNVSFHSSSKRKVSILIVSENISENYFRKIVILILFLNLIQTSTFHPIYLFIQRKRNFNLKIFSKIKSDPSYFPSNLFTHSEKKKCFVLFIVEKL